ncbi:hypothetical protein BpHYR1_040698, partial [Brachionus plicatilis]
TAQAALEHRLSTCSRLIKEKIIRILTRYTHIDSIRQIENYKISIKKFDWDICIEQKKTL